MPNRGSDEMNRSAILGAIMTVMFGAATALPSGLTHRSTIVKADSPAEVRFKAAGKGASVTVTPSRLAGVAVPQVGETVALLLEQRGMTNLETSPAVFTPPENAELTVLAKSFGEFVRANPQTSDYVLFTEINGTKDKGVAEVRAVIVSTLR